MTEKLWYYHDNGTSVGPFSWSRIAELCEASFIQKDTQVWQEGTSDWRQFHEAAYERQTKPPPLPLAGEAVTRSVSRRRLRSTKETRSSHGWESRPLGPWRRFFARMFDTMFNGFLGVMLFWVAFYAFVPSSADHFRKAIEGPGGASAGAFLVILIALPINALMIGITGSTIGKVLFGVKVVDQGLKPIGLLRAFRRELHVWFAGQGIGFPIVTVICQLFAYRRLAKTGATSWDKSQDLVVLHRPEGPSQTLLSMIGTAMIVGMTALLAMG